VAISDRRNGEALSEFMSQVAAMSWAETKQPETRLANDSRMKIRFFNANHTDVFSCCSVATCKSKGRRLFDAIQLVNVAFAMPVLRRLAVGINDPHSFIFDCQLRLCDNSWD
jgi:hypothetical protein